MRLSRFIATYRDAAPGEHVLYDVVEDRYVGVDDRALAAIARWRDASPAEDERESAGTLREMGFLVEGEADDDARLAFAEARARREAEATTYATILPTLACNLACTYCVQQDTPNTRMDAATEEETVAFVLRKVDEARSARLTVHYIGGEPLTRKDLLLRTAERFAAAMRERGGTFDWELTTNGIGLRAEFLKALLAHGKGSVKLTLDGDRETNDLARVWRSGQGTFDEVYGALLEVARECPGVSLRLGGNFRGGQVESYERLLDRLEQDGLRGRFEFVRFKPVVDLAPSCGSCAEAPGEASGLVQLGSSVKRRGLGREQGKGGVDALGGCEIHWDNAWVIDPDGNVYRCFSLAGHPEMRIGTVRDGAGGQDRLAAARPWATDPGCATCPYVPTCYGGCLAGAYLTTGRSGTVLCKRDWFEKTFREEVVQRYLAEFHPMCDASRAA